MLVWLLGSHVRAMLIINAILRSYTTFYFSDLIGCIIVNTTLLEYILLSSGNPIYREHYIEEELSCGFIFGAFAVHSAPRTIFLSDSRKTSSCLEELHFQVHASRPSQ